jgi:thiamine transport system ATP-binding protein
MLKVDSVHVQLGEVDVLHDVSFSVDEGETVALLGPSGGGKTTLLRVIAGLETPVAGRVSLDGRDLAGVPVHERNIGLMFQDYALFPHRTVEGNVEFGLRMHRVSKPDRRARVAEVLELVGLSGFEARSVSQLSGGERQRVALARSLAPGPRLLMLDEPLGSLDRTLHDRLVLELRHVFAAQGIGVVYVTHDQTEALALADRVTLLHEGRVVQSDTPRALWSRPCSPFVARFLGFTNLIDVEVRGGQVLTPAGVLTDAPQRRDGAAIALIRPSAVHLVEESPLTARVESVVFHGDRTTIALVVDQDLRLDALVGSVAPHEGETVAFEVDAGGVQLFPIEPT